MHIQDENQLTLDTVIGFVLQFDLQEVREFENFTDKEDVIMLFVKWKTMYFGTGMEILILRY